MYTFWGLENILESIEDRDWDVYGLEADGEKHPSDIVLKRENKTLKVSHIKNGIYASPRESVVFDSNTGIVNEYRGNKLHKTHYAHRTSHLGSHPVVELSDHPKKVLLSGKSGSEKSHLPAVRGASDVRSNLAEDKHLVRTHTEQIKHIFANIKDEEDLKQSVPQLKHHLEEIRKIADKVLKENHGLKDREEWEKVHEEAVKWHEFVDEGDFTKLRRSLKMGSHEERASGSTHEGRTMYGDRHGNVSETPFMDRGPRRITHDRNSKPGKDFDEAMREAHRQKKEDEWWAKAAKDEDFQKKAVAHLNRLAKQSEEESDRIIAEYGKKKGTTIKSDNGGWTSTTVPLGDKKEEASKGFSKAKQELSEGKKGLSLAHKLALGAGGVAAAGALGWATKGRGKAAVKAAEKGWSTGRKAAVGAAGVAGVGAVGYGGYRARHSDKHRR